MTASSHFTRLLTLALCTLTLTLSACHSSKSAYTGDVTTTAASSATTDQLFASLAESYGSWQDLYVPVQVSLESPKKMSISGRATMIYGKEIYISLRMLGMEVGIIYLNNDNVYVVDKFHKYYFQEDIKKLLNGVEINLTDVQDLLLGRGVIPGKGILKADDAKDFTFLSSDDLWILTPERQFKNAEWHYLATKTEPPLIASISLRLKSGSAVECRFAEPTSTAAGIVDGVTTLTLPMGDNDIRLSLTWELDGAKWDSGREVNFNPPTSSSYKRLNLESVLHALE